MQDYNNLEAFSGAVVDVMVNVKKRRAFVVGDCEYRGRNPDDGSQFHLLNYVFRVYTPGVRGRGQRLVPVSRLRIGVNIERGDGSVEDLLEADLGWISRVLNNDGRIRVERIGNRLKLETRI